MFTQPSSNQAGLENAINDLLREMTFKDADSKEYAFMADQLVKLYSLRETPKRISPDTLAAVAGNVFGIILIVNHERLNVVTSRAMSLLFKAQP